MFYFIFKKLLSLRRDENGAVIVMTLGMFLFIYMLCISIYAVGTSVHERMRLQNIADAAAYSASVAQADGLSRIALINRAMSWTYIQMTRMQMDYIVHRWLKKTVDNFNDDLEKTIKPWNDYINYTPSFRDYSWGFYIFLSLLKCPDHNVGKEDRSNNLGTCWIGWTPGDDHLIRLGYVTDDEKYQLNSSVQPQQTGFLASWETLKQMVASADAEDIANSIQYNKDILNLLNGFMAFTCNTTNATIYECAKQVMEDSIPEREQDDYRFILKPMSMAYPYSENVQKPSINDPKIREELQRLQNMQANLGTNSNDNTNIDSMLSPYRNTEEDELEFLSMSMDTSSLHDIFGDGIDQWFVRGHEKVLKDASEVVPPDIENYTGYGIQRGYKTANRVEAGMDGPRGGSIYRGNHIAVGNVISLVSYIISLLTSNILQYPELIPPVAIELFTGRLWDTINIILPSITNLKGDINPSSFNSKQFFAEQCGDIPNNYGLVSEYHWSSMRWWCPQRWKFIWIKTFWGKYPFGPIEIKPHVHYKLNPINRCEIQEHRYDNFNEGFRSHTRANYKSCVMGVDDLSGGIYAKTHDSENNVHGYITAGHTRIYGDDKEIYNDHYTGARVMPVKLNAKFFQDANIVVLAKKRRNPLSIAASDDEILDTGNLLDSSLYALFNTLRKESGHISDEEEPWLGRWVCAVSASRPAYRERNATGYLAGRVYRTKYSVMSSDQKNQSTNSNGAPIQLKVEAGGSNSIMATRLTRWPYRFGCPHKVSGNKIAERLKRTWNLCETDWDAVFVPVKYNMGHFSINYDGLNEDSTNVHYKEKATSGENAAVNPTIGDLMNCDPMDQEKGWWTSFRSPESKKMLDVDILDKESQAFKPSLYIRALQDYLHPKKQ